MSEENVEIVRRMYDAYYAGDADGALAYFTPDVVSDIRTGSAAASLTAATD